jgi:hypothetical protein
MPRRAGKAASRRARQRAAERASRGARPAPAARPMPAPASLPVPPVGTPDAHEAVALDPPPRKEPPPDAVGDSRLGDRAQAEYQYVEKDLRNIAIITVVMAAILLLAWFVFQATGLTT